MFNDLRTTESDGERWVSLTDLRNLLNNTIAAIALDGLLSSDVGTKRHAATVCDTFDGLDRILSEV